MPKNPSEMTQEEVEAELQALQAAKPAAPKDPANMTQEEIEAELKGIDAGKPSFWKDVKEGSYPALERGILGLQTAPVTMADLGLKGAGFLSKHIPYTSDETAEKLSGGIESARNALDPYTYGGALDKAAVYDPAIKHQNETIPGQYLQTGIEYVPGTMAALLTGGESALPTIVKGASSALGSETGGQIADWLAPGSGWGDYARMAGALFGVGGLGTARKLASPGTPTTAAGVERLAKAQAIEKLAPEVPVSAAQQTGSRLMATLEGRPPSKQMEKLSEAMTEKGNLQPGPTREAALKATNKALDATRDDLKANTAVNVDKDLRSKLTNEVNSHTSRLNNTSMLDPAVVQGMKDFNAMVQNGKLPGAAYADLRKSWSNPKAPTELNNMAGHLDQAMEASHPGQWSGYFNDVANYKALKKGHQAAPEGVIPPSAVNPKRPTELADLAQAGRMIEPSRFPPPYNFESLLTSTGGAGTALAKGAEGGVLTYLLLHGAPAAGRMLTGPVARSAPVQAWQKLHYWTPNEYTSLPNKRVGAALLGQPAGAFLNPPEDQTQ